MRLKKTLLVIAVSSILFGCASQQVAPIQTPAQLNVSYTQQYPSEARLKEIPNEITIVKREATSKNVGTQVALNVLLLAVGGGVGVQGFSKDGLKGAPITDVKDRRNLQNPIPNTFVNDLRSNLNALAQAQPEFSSKVYRNAFMITDGHTRLVYENLTGTEEETFRLKTDLLIYKRKETAGMFSISPFVEVDCKNQSPEPLPLATWAEQDYQLVRKQLTAMLDQCAKKVAMELPNFLKE